MSKQGARADGGYGWRALKHRTPARPRAPPKLALPAHPRVLAQARARQPGDAAHGHGRLRRERRAPGGGPHTQALVLAGHLCLDLLGHGHVSMEGVFRTLSSLSPFFPYSLFLFLSLPPSLSIRGLVELD